MSDESFYLKIAKALSGCQIIEQELKLYISEALALIEKLVDGRMPFKMTGQDYENYSLERLIGAFKKLSENPGLVADLERFKGERNFLSHKGITHCLDPDGELYLPSSTEFEVRLTNIQEEAQRLRIAIHEEANKFRPHLWFDDPSK